MLLVWQVFVWRSGLQSIKFKYTMQFLVMPSSETIWTWHTDIMGEQCRQDASCVKWHFTCIRLMTRLSLTVSSSPNPGHSLGLDPRSYDSLFDLGPNFCGPGWTFGNMLVTLVRWILGRGHHLGHRSPHSQLPRNTVLKTAHRLPSRVQAQITILFIAQKQEI